MEAVVMEVPLLQLTVVATEQRDPIIKTEDTAGVKVATRLPLELAHDTAPRGMAV
jgi:hypothetical protein